MSCHDFHSAQNDADGLITQDREAVREESSDGGVSSPVDDGKTENERLANFFAGLMKKTSSPRS